MDRTFYIETFGCQMNKCDSELMEFSMGEAGFKKIESPEDADILIINTCSVRQHAEDRVIARIRSTRNKMKEHCIIVIAGCMAQRIGDLLIKRNDADIVVGPYQSPDIGNAVILYLNNKKENIYLSQKSEDFESRINTDFLPRRITASRHEWVTITHGCENFCSYCIVPYVRGKLISFPSGMIIDYIKRLAENGVKEITLLGQNVNQYGQDSSDIPFFSLLEKASQVKGIARINFLTSHPKDFNENIIKVIRDNENISRGIHLPLQSGSDRILKLMNRQYTVRHYLDIFEKIDKIMDTYSISTDLIVGFPGESDEDYRDTLQAVDTVRFDEAFMYAYSPREGTAAYNLEEELTRDEKIERLNNLIHIQRGITLEKLKARIDKTELMIVERISRRSSGEVMGKSFLNHPVITPGSAEDIGKQIRVEVTEIKGASLFGERIV